MRLLLSFILTFSLFLASHDSEGASKQGNKTEVIASDSVSETGIRAFSEYGHHLQNVAHKTNVRNATNQYRFFAGIHPEYSSVDIAQLVVSLSENRLEERYSHCTPIGQKLLFPKHYFW